MPSSIPFRSRSRSRSAHRAGPGCAVVSLWSRSSSWFGSAPRQLWAPRCPNFLSLRSAGGGDENKPNGAELGRTAPRAADPTSWEVFIIKASRGATVGDPGSGRNQVQSRDRLSGFGSLVLVTRSGPNEASGSGVGRRRVRGRAEEGQGPGGGPRPLP